MRRKWFRTMIRKRVTRKLWDYGMRWVCEIMQRTSTQAGGFNVCTPIESVTGETADISEYLDFGFYDRVWYHENAGLGERLHGRWLGDRIRRHRGFVAVGVFHLIQSGVKYRVLI